MSDQTPTSPFAPPRAGRSAWFWQIWYSVARRYAIGAIRAPFERIAKARPVSGAVVVFIPLYGLYQSKWHRFVRYAAWAYFLGFFFSIAGYGEALGGAAFGLMAGIHGLGIAAYLDTESPAGSRLYGVCRSAVLTAVVCVLLGFFLNSVMQRFVVPVRGSSGVVLINKLDRRAPPAVGELVAYEMADGYAAGVRVVSGIYFGTVLAGPGSTIRFLPGHYLLGGERRASLPYMPAEGEIAAGPEQSLIWPVVFQFSNRAGGTMRAEIVKVDDSALVGRPFKRWFWRTFNP